jgi:hypothetical protein
MTLSIKTIKSFKNKSTAEIWNYITALQHHQNALYQLEKNESDPELLKDIATQASEIGKELSEILNLLEDKIED